jgi:hypothetical protein
MQEQARRLALTAGFCVEAALLASTAQKLGKDDAVGRFADFVEHRLSLLI